MSFEMRNNTAMSKRAEQLKRWEESDTNREPDYPKNEAGRRIKFSSGCVFLAACLSGDKEEVLRLLDAGADIDTANVDGLTALHQACIDDNLEMVEFLVQAGADVNRQDNEGWTPLHATSSCGFLSIARFLIESGANLAAVSSDGELVVDLAESDRMEALLQRHIEEQGIDCDEARQSEERLMLSDAKNWLRSDASEADKPHPRTGATALHVAAAKGYSKVLSLLLATRADVDKQDNDGWTPLHAAAHWGQKEAAQMLVASLADMDVKNYAGQTVFEVADPSALRFLEDLKKNNKRSKRRPASQIRISDGMDNHIETTPTKVIRVEVLSNESKDADVKPKPPSEPTASLLNKDTKNEEDTPWRRSGSLRSRQQQESPPKNQMPPPPPDKEPPQPPQSQPPPLQSQPLPPTTTTTTGDTDVILRRTQSFENDEKKTVLSPIVGSPTTMPPPPTTPTAAKTTLPSGQVRRSAAEELVRSQFSAFKNMPSPVIQLERRSSNRLGGSTASLNKLPDPMSTSLTLNSRNASSISDLNSTPAADPKRHVDPKQQSAAPTNVPVTKTTPPPPPSVVETEATNRGSKFTPSNIFKSFFKSFVPPSRDEESETQRKAHAKRVRETRRSTQGVTLDEIKSAEELIKKKNANNNNNTFKLEDVVVTLAAPGAVISTTTTSSTIVTPATTGSGVPITAQRRGYESRPISAPVIGTVDHQQPPPASYTTTNTTNNDRVKDATNEVVTLPLRRSKVTDEDKENDKENDSRSAQATQAVIQRRRRPKRRSTGVVNVDMDDIDPERQEGTDGADEKESGSERTSRSRLGSTSSLVSDANDLKSESTENGDLIDYKALYEAARLDNDKLKVQLKKKDDDLLAAKATVDRFANATTKNSLSELEKRERRAMERKLSEMEEELKHLEALKTENQRLKDENGALIRVISKLSK